MKDKKKSKKTSNDNTTKLKVQDNFNEEISKEIYAKDLADKSKSHSKGK